MSARVVKIKKIKDHPKASNLQFTRINGNVTIFPSGDFRTGDLAVYIAPGTVVPTERPEFNWLPTRKSHYRVGTIRLRGIPSVGFLLRHEPGDGPEGSDVSADLGIETPDPPTLWQRIKKWLVS